MTTWMFNQAALAEDRPVYAVDLPGHGGSKELERGAVELAAASSPTMDAAGIGGPSRRPFARRRESTIALTEPDRVARLTLIAPAGLGPEIASEFIEGFITESRARKLKPVIEMLVADPTWSPPTWSRTC